MYKLPESPCIYAMHEAAELLDVSLDHMRTLIKRHNIPKAQYTKHIIYIEKEVLEKFLNDHPEYIKQ